jgi:hypothetical protein
MEKFIAEHAWFVYLVLTGSGGLILVLIKITAKNASDKLKETA